MLLFRAFILRPLWQEKLRTSLTILGVTLGVAVMLAIQLANQGSLRGFSAALDAVSGKAALEITAPPLGVDETLLPSLHWLRQYGIATPVIEADVIARSPASTTSSTLRVIGVDSFRDPALRDYSVGSQSGAASGMQLMTFLSQPGALMVSQPFAESQGLEVGSNLELLIGDRTVTCSVSAILTPPSGTVASTLASQSIAIMDIANAQVILGRLGRVDRLELRLHEGISVAAAEQALKSQLPPSLTVQRPQRRSSAVETMLAAFHFNLTMLSGIALVVGLFLIYNTVSVAVMTRRREIGMLRTLGVTRLQVLRFFLGEALALGLLGALLGVPLSSLLAKGAVALTATTVDTLYVRAAAQVPPLTLTHLLAGLALALPLALLAALFPALEASRVAPVEAMRGESASLMQTSSARRWLPLSLAALTTSLGIYAALQPPVHGLSLWAYLSCGCAILAMALVVPSLLFRGVGWLRPFMARFFGIEGRLATSQIRASTRRLSVSVAALAVSLALTVAIAVMVGSFRSTVLYWVNQTMGADLYVRPGTPPRSLNPPRFSETTLAVLRQHPAVLAVDDYSSMDLLYGDRYIKLGAADFALQLQHGRLAFKTSGDSKDLLRTALSGEAILVSESFALRFQVREGDVITLTTAKGPQPFRIAAQYYDYSNDSGAISMDRALFRRWFGESAPTHIAIYLKPGSNPDQVRTEMLQSLGAGSLVAIFTNAGLRAEVLRIFDSTFAITWALELIAILVAMAGIAATMLTLVMERLPEIRLLRIAGADVAQVRRTIVLESGLLGAVSQCLGLAVGLLLSLLLIHVINPQSFGWSIQFHSPWWFLLGSTILTIAAAMLAGLYPAWRAAKSQISVTPAS